MYSINDIESFFCVINISFICDIFYSSCSFSIMFYSKRGNNIGPDGCKYLVEGISKCTQLINLVLGLQ